MDNYSVVFPGQGAQKQGMGTDLFEISEDIFFKAEKVYPDIKSILGKTNEELSDTILSQPALFVVSSAIWFALKGDLKPSFLAGHSVGEYVACYASGCIKFEDALKLIKVRSRLMSQSSGTMFACLGSFEDVDKFVKYIIQITGAVCEIANYNHDSQIVISCDESAVNEINQSYKSFNIKRCIQLKVSGGFHSSLVSNVKEELESEIEKIEFKNAEIPIICNKTGIATSDAEIIKNNLINHVISGVQWKKTMDYMKNQNVNIVIELGSGNVLSKLAEKSNMSSMTINNINDIVELKKEL